MDFNHILNWKLLSGSHKFPGPEGGTCINEAAIVASGFEYRTVRNSHDCPPCFSTLFSEYALGLNDGIMIDNLRQELLMPFVTRLAGTADTLDVEMIRAKYMTEQVEERIYKPYIGEDQDNTYPTFDAWRYAWSNMNSANWYCEANPLQSFPAAIGRALGEVVIHICVMYIGDHNLYDIDLYKKLYATATDILSEAMEIGNKASDPDLLLVVERFEAIKAKSMETA